MIKRFVKKMQSILNFAVQKINCHAENVDNPYVVFGVFGAIAYPTFYLIWRITESKGYENLALRLVAMFLCIPLIFKDKWSKTFIKFLSLYWYLTLLYCLPFLFTFILLKNNFSFAASMNGLSVLVLSILLLDLIALLILFPIGVILGWLIYIATSGQVNYPPDFSALIISYSSVLIVGAIFARSKLELQKEKLEAMKLLGASIAHELRTPFAALNLVANGMRKYFNYLVQGYELAKNANLPVQPINSSQIELLSKIPNTIEQESKAANLFIDLLLSNVNPTIGNDTSEIISLSHCVDEALNRYPFTDEQRRLIQWQSENDFIIKAKEVLIIHLLFNLLKNALYYLAKAGNKNNKGIYIWIEQGKDSNKLFFKDTGTGMSKDILPYIFNRFFSKTDHGSGIGLTYCKMVMESLGGSIACESEINHYTLFIMSFPIVKI